MRSDFFQTHEVIGSSLLFVHDRTQASIWMIDFAKTVSLPDSANITHISEWIVGNHEDGYLIGINNLIQIFEELLAAETTPLELNANEAEMCDVEAASDSQADSTAAQPNNVDLPQEIDAMKIDQTMDTDRPEHSQ